MPARRLVHTHLDPLDDYSTPANFSPDVAPYASNGSAETAMDLVRFHYFRVDAPETVHQTPAAMENVVAAGLSPVAGSMLPAPLLRPSIFRIS